MSEVRQITRYFQKCDFCNADIEVKSSKSCDALDYVRLPATYYNESERSSHPSIVYLSVCDKCLNELKSLIETKWKISEYEYSGVSVEKVGE